MRARDELPNRGDELRARGAIARAQIVYRIVREDDPLDSRLRDDVPLEAVERALPRAILQELIAADPLIEDADGAPRAREPNREVVRPAPIRALARYDAVR